MCAPRGSCMPMSMSMSMSKMSAHVGGRLLRGVQ